MIKLETHHLVHKLMINLVDTAVDIFPWTLLHVSIAKAFSAIHYISNGCCPVIVNVKYLSVAFQFLNMRPIWVIDEFSVGRLVLKFQKLALSETPK